MSRQIQIRRGTAAQHDSFTGAIGEITMDTTNKTIRVHDGVTAGGTVLAKKSEIPTTLPIPDNYDFVIETQLPTAQNNYTWYRKYKSGWVEQGGTSVSANTPINLPVTMANNCYTAPMPGITAYASTVGIGADAIVITKTTQTIQYGTMSAFGFTFDWYIAGFCA